MLGLEITKFLKKMLMPLLSPFVSSDRPEDALACVEDRIMEAVACPHEKYFVDIGMNSRIWTLAFNVESTNVPLVLLHGMGTGVALWALNFRSLSSNRPVYAIDILGFGQSSRTVFSSDPIVAEMEFVESLEEWRKKMELETFILLGHCFGGFIATSYAICHPDRVRHLMLVNPWGFSDHSKINYSDRRVPMPSWIKTLGYLIQPFNPLSILRAARSFGPTLVKKFRPDLIRNYEELLIDDAIPEYIYEWNALLPTGETAFKHSTHDFGWAIYPMINRVKDIAVEVAITNIFGSRSWVDSSLGQQIKQLRPKSYVATQIVSGAGYYVFADKSDLFNRIVNQVCLLVDHHLDIIPSRILRDQLRSKSESAPNLRLAHPSLRRLTRHRLHHNSVCLSEADEDQPKEAVTSPTSVARPVFNISYDDNDDD